MLRLLQYLSDSKSTILSSYLSVYIYLFSKYYYEGLEANVTSPIRTYKSRMSGINLSICSSIYLSAHLSIYLLIYLFICSSIYLSAHLSIYLLIYLFICKSIYLVSIFNPIYHLSIYIKRDFTIEKKIAPIFIRYSRCLSNPHSSMHLKKSTFSYFNHLSQSWKRGGNSVNGEIHIPIIVSLV